MKSYCFWLAVVLGTCARAQEDPGTTPFPRAPTSFSCHGRPPGYYADLETGCRTYHVCDGNSQFTYVCPKRTLFQQSDRICDHSYRVRCEDSKRFYEAEEEYEDEGGPEGSTPSSKGDYEDEYDQTDEFIPTESTPFETDEIPTTILITPKPTIYTATIPTATARTTPAATPNTDSTTVSLKEENAIHKFLKFRLKDFRSLFFIPEFENNSIVAKPERELILPVEKDFLIFKNRREGRRRSFPSCPAYCNPKFFLPGTCHPCIMIK